jgi:uncharacterized protein YjeT (DUF2065 family)
MTALLIAFGGVLVFEGLVLALAPRRLEDMLRLLAKLPLEQRRMMGLAAIAAGVFLIWLAKG